MTRTAARLVAFFLCLIMSAAQSTFAEDVTLARIGSNVIDAATLRELLPPLDAAQRRAVAADPAAQAQLVRSVLVQRVVIELARRDNWDQTPVAQRQMAAARDAALAESYLRAVCQVPETYPSEQELQAFYQANQRAFMEPPRYRLAQLFVSVPAADPAATANAQAKLDPVLAALAEPDADFADLVRRFSDEKDSASRGGEVGWLTESQLRPELRPLLADLKAGQVSRPVRLADGWHIVKCLELRPESPVPFADIRAALADRMRAERTAANRQAYLARLLQENPISLNELALRDLLATAP
jgi:parvulin-like peptidyl-prolyl isomerase